MSALKQQSNELPVLNQEKNLELIKKYRETKDLKIRNQIVEGNLRLTYSLANKYQKQKGLEFDDLVQEGSFGIIRAIETYDETKGAFSNYAMQWINQAMYRFWYTCGSLIRIPETTNRDMQKYHRASNELKFELGRKPTTDEIAKRMKLSNKKIKTLEGNMISITYFENSVKNDDTHEGEKEISYIGALENREAAAEFENIEKEELKGIIDKYLYKVYFASSDRFEWRSIEMFEHIYGLNGKQRLTIDEVAKKYGCTKQCANNLKLTVRKKLSIYKELKEFYA